MITIKEDLKEKIKFIINLIIFFVGLYFAYLIYDGIGAYSVDSLYIPK